MDGRINSRNRSCIIKKLFIYTAVALVLMLPSCSQSHYSLLVPVYFYQGHNVGNKTRATGLHVAPTGKSRFKALTWPELISSSAAVDSSGIVIYLACGNGVLVSKDSGQNWSLTGGYELAEVQKVEVDREDSQRAWAASAFGLWRTDNAGADWAKVEDSLVSRYCADVRQDMADSDTLWVAGERGVFVSRDRGMSFTAALPGIETRRVLPLPGRVLACTDGGGLVESVDRGGSFSRITGPPDTVFCVEVKGERMYCGAREGLFASTDGGSTWTTTKEGLPDEYYIYAVVEDPENQKRILISGNDGLFISTDGGTSFERHGFEKALVPDLTVAQLKPSEAAGPPAEPGTLIIPGMSETYNELRDEINQPFDRRRQELLRFFHGRAAAIRGWPGWATAAQQAADGNATKDLLDQLDDRLKDPQHSMFYSLPLMGFYLHAADKLSLKTVDTIRRVMTTNSIYRGDTENHWVMYYTALLLAAQTWPDTSAADWYAGRSTQEMYEEARDWLLHWADTAAKVGQGEYDSPNYLMMYITPLVLLYDFAEEPLVRHMAGMVLDLLLADYLTESLQGAWCGGHSRVADTEIEKTVSNRASVYHFLYAGGIPLIWGVPDWMGFAAMSDYRPPRVLEGVANDRDAPYIHEEVKRTRNVIRYSEELNPPVYKYSYMTPNYCIGSLRGDVLSLVQQHSFDVTWMGSEENSLLYSVHPYVSGRDLGMFFPEDPHDLARTVTKQKPVFGSKNKMISGSPFEKIYQYENLLVASYSVPEDAVYPHVNLYWPKHLSRTEDGGWLFGRDGGFYLALHVTAEGVWRDKKTYDRYRFSGNGTTVTMLAGTGESDMDFENFKADILEFELPAIVRSGNTDMLYNGPFVSSELGSGIIRITDGDTVRILDFNTYNIDDRSTQ